MVRHKVAEPFFCFNRQINVMLKANTVCKLVAQNTFLHVIRQIISYPYGFDRIIAHAYCPSSVTSAQIRAVWSAKLQTPYGHRLLLEKGTFPPLCPIILHKIEKLLLLFLANWFCDSRNIIPTSFYSFYNRFKTCLINS